MHHYYINKTVKGSFQSVIEKLVSELKEEGFGILTEIDVRETLKAKLGVDIKNYKILGPCNPPYAYKALQAEPRIGLLLPCKVIVREIDGGEVEVAAIDPVWMMKGVENPELEEVATQIKEKLQKVIERV